MSTTRRDFLKTATTAALATAMSPGTKAFAAVAGSDAIRIGLIGCGGRGTRRGEDAPTSSHGLTLVPKGDAFPAPLPPTPQAPPPKVAGSLDPGSPASPPFRPRPKGPC